MLKIKKSGSSPYAGRIRSAISLRGRTRSDVARTIGLSLNAMSQITLGETRSPDADIIRALALELDVSVAYLMGETTEIEKPGG